MVAQVLALEMGSACRSAPRGTLAAPRDEPFLAASARGSADAPGTLPAVVADTALPT
jgi:hypothetical protein